MEITAGKARYGRGSPRIQCPARFNHRKIDIRHVYWAQCAAVPVVCVCLPVRVCGLISDCRRNSTSLWSVRRRSMHLRCGYGSPTFFYSRARADLAFCTCVHILSFPHDNNHLSWESEYWWMIIITSNNSAYRVLLLEAIS